MDIFFKSPIISFFTYLCHYISFWRAAVHNCGHTVSLTVKFTVSVRFRVSAREWVWFRVQVRVCNSLGLAYMLGYGLVLVSGLG